MTILYHYTTPAGLHGIINSKSVWAGEYNFLNDATELHYGLDLLHHELKTCMPRLLSMPGLLDMIDAIRNGMADESVFIASFTRNGDLLSQWRGYTKGYGFAIGIEADYLIRSADHQGFKCAPVIYDSACQAEEIHKLLISLEKRFESDLGDKEPEKQVRGWWSETMGVLPFIKNKYFQEEQEMRLVRVTSYGQSDVQTRPTEKGLVPYIPFRLDAAPAGEAPDRRRKLGIDHIVLGPSLHDRQVQAVKVLLHSQGMCANVRKSNIPYIAD